MTSAARSSSPRRGRRSAGQLILGALVALGAIASIFLVFSDSVQLLRIGLVVALWAAIIGGIAMTKYRREAAVDRAKTRDLQTVYELQLEREIAARREYENTVEQRVREEVRADTAEIAGLREELAALRRSLEVIFDGKLPDDRPALRAESSRVPELAGRPTPPVNGAPQPTFATPYDAPITAETTAITEDDDEPVPAHVRPFLAKVPTATWDRSNRPAPSADPAAAPTAPAAPATPTAPAAPAASATQTSGAKPADPEPAGARRRRRAEPETGGLSVAEIMANLQAEGGGRPRSR